MAKSIWDELEEVDPFENENSNIQINNSNKSTSIWDELEEVDPFENENSTSINQTQPQSSGETHPLVSLALDTVSSLPEAGKQLGVRSVKSVPQFLAGAGDLLTLAGDSLNWQGLSNVGRNANEFWQGQSDKIQIDPKYQGVQGLTNSKTWLPTAMGFIGDNATNIATSVIGGGAALNAAKTIGLASKGQKIASIAGTALPNLAQEGQYLEKIENFKKIYGREPNNQELKDIQNVALGEKGVNSVIETVSDLSLFGKFLPGGSAKGLKKLAKDMGHQAITEAGTEGVQESVSIGAEKLLGLNQASNLDNLKRIGEAAVIGGVTGAGMVGTGKIGGKIITNGANFVKNNISQPVKEVSAKLYNGGRELYNSAANGINNAVTDINGTVNRQAAFDALRELSQNGDFQNQLQAVAPNTMQKMQDEINNSTDVGVENTGLPNLMTDNENLYNITNNGESEITSQNDVQEIAKEVREKTEKEINSQPENQEHQFKEGISDGWGDKHYDLTDKDNNILGYVEYSNRDNNSVDINYVRNTTDKDRTGIGTKLIDKVLSENPDKFIIWDAVPDKKAQAFRESYINKHPEIKNRVTTEKMYNYFVAQAKEKGYNNVVDFINDRKKSNDRGRTNRQSDIDVSGTGNAVLERTGKSNIGSNGQNNRTGRRSENEISEKGLPPQTFDRWNERRRSKKRSVQKVSTNKTVTAKLINTLAPETTKNTDINNLKQVVKAHGYNSDIIDKLINHSANIDDTNAASKVYLHLKNIPDSINTANELKSLLDEQRQHNENREVKDNGIYNSGSETGNRGSIERLSGELQEYATVVRNKSKVDDRNSESSNGRNRSTRSTGDVSDRNGRLVDNHKDLIEKQYKNQHELNQAIENFIKNKEYEKYNGDLPQAIKEWLKKYTGAGGLEKQGAEGKGLLSEYYTPPNIVNKMWDLTKQYINTDGANVLEPSCGIGRFLDNAPNNTSFDVYEMNPISAKITELLYPNANVITGEFQEKFIDKKTSTPVKTVNPEYDIVIGNPPYGQYSGRYKGLGEGKGISRIEQYFIKRGLDTLKENGIMTFIVPSSFLNGEISKSKQDIVKQSELLDAYRLPENTFDTTSIGTDIIILRKTNAPVNSDLFNFGRWFKEHPNKILGSTETRKNRFGKEETYVKGDKNAVDNIDISKQDIKETKQIAKKDIEKSVVRKNRTTVKKSLTVQKANIEYEEYIPENPVSDKEYQLFADTKVDGSLPDSKYSPSNEVNMFNGKLYNDFNYLQGDIYEKLDALENEDISMEQKNLQRKKLMSVLPKPKTLEQINLTPTSDFIREYPIQDTIYDSYRREEITETTYLDKKYLRYVENLSQSERNNVSVWDIRKYVQGEKISVDYKGNPTKEEKENQRAEYLTNLKNTVDKTFNDFLNAELSPEIIKDLTDKWNRKFNKLYTPDYKKMPMIVKGLNSQFKGKKLKLQDVQIEGINFLANKGVGCLAFEVGVGKTLSGIISTVQNMQMGRCKRPLILVPKQVKPKWIEEINEAFPNIKVNDLDNLSKFNGEIEEGSLSVATFQALDNIWYNPETIEKLKNNTYETSSDFNRESTKRGKEQAKERNEEFIGEAEKNNKKLHTFESLGFDHILTDEAHNFKNLFSKANADGQEGNIYTKITGAESTRAKRMFLATQYILANNGNRNIFMLTATPFNNSPLEVFNMLSYIAKDKLDNMGLYNVYQFMENYVDITADWVIDSKNNVTFKQIPKGFKNLQSLQSIIDTCMLIRSADDAGVKRPNKHTKRIVLEPTDEQLDLISQAEAEAVGIKTDNEGNISISNKRNGGEVLKAISKARTVTLSPDIYKNNYEVSPEEFINNSPKLNYVMNAIASMKKKNPKTGQLIYMPLGVDFLPKIKDYLVNKEIYKSNEIAIIKSGVNDDKINEITKSFNDKDGDIKLVIGTNKMREGMDLNGYTSVLYVPFMDWNPTDYKQIVGRIWRRGNDYNDIRVVVPLLKNSSDPFMFQKLDEKTSRINNIMTRGKDYIDTSELDTSEEKINMITNPDKKAAMFSLVEEQKLNNEKNKLQGQLETTKYYKNELKNVQDKIDGLENNIKRNEERLNSIEDKESYTYKAVKGSIDDYKKDLAKAKQSLKYTKARIERLELDFNGKDSEENIQAKIQEVEKQKELLKEKTEQKLAKYKDEYEKNRANSKSIKDLISEFEKETYELYPEENSKSEDSKPLDGEHKKKYEKTREHDYSIPVIKLETQAQKRRKEKEKTETNKSKDIVNAKQYNKKLKEGIAKWSSEINIRRYEVDRTLNAFINITKTIAKQIRVKDKHLREIMPFLRERTEFPDELAKNRPELKEVWNKVNNDKTLKENVTQLADSASEKFEKYWNEYNIVQASGENIEDRKGVNNYIFHDWKQDKNSPKTLITSAFITKSKHAKKRTIPTYYEGIQGIEQENGEIKKYVPETLDYAVLLKKSSDNLIKATVDKVLADSVRTFKTSEGASLILPENKAPNDWIEINNSSLNKTVARPVSTSFGEKVSPILVNKFAEMGFAIGNRLSKYKANGMPNSLGKYVKNQPPEIRLQRWFSTKTLAHEVGHALDEKLGLSKDGFVYRHKDELLELNKERIEAFSKQGDRKYAEKDSELIAELFGVMFNDVESALKFAPGATSEIMERMTKDDKLKDLLPDNFDWSEAKHVLEEKVVEFFKMPVKVHPDIAATLKTVFENKKEYLDILGHKPGKLYDEHTALMKMLEFSYSLFHYGALSESFLGNVGIKGLKEVLNFKKIFNSIKNNDYDIYKKDEIARQAIQDGLQLGTPLDINRGAVETLINNTTEILEKEFKGIGKAPSMVLKIGGKTMELSNKALWDVAHNNYKLTTYELLIDKETRKKGSNLTNAQRQEIAQWTNDSFGGLTMELLGIGSNSKKTLSRVFMSPDWLIATTRQFMGIFSSTKLHKTLNKLSEYNNGWQKVKELSQNLGIISLTDDVTASGTRGRIARAFFIRSAIISAIYMNILNAIFRKWDKEEHPEMYPKELKLIDYTMLGNAKGDRTYIFIGRNKDGSERYLRLGKQYREMPEMVSDPIKHIGAKFSPIIQSAVTVLSGHNIGGFENKEISNSEGWKRLGLGAKNLTTKYVPLSFQNYYNKKIKGIGADFTPFDLIGNTSKGMTKYKAGQEFKKAFEHGNKPNTIDDIKKSMLMNGISKTDINTIYKSAKTQYTKRYKDDYIKALQEKNKDKKQKIDNKILKNNFTKEDQRKIYAKALEEFYKSRNIK